MSGACAVEEGGVQLVKRWTWGSKGIYVDERSLSGSGFRAGLSPGCMDFGQR